MAIDFVDAFKAPFKGEGWPIKLLIGGLLFMIPIANFIVMGQLVRYIKNVINGVEQIDDLSGDQFAVGAKYVGGCILLYLLPILIILFGALSQDQTILTVCILVYCVLVLIFGFLMGPLTCVFAMTEKATSMIDLGKAFSLIKGNGANFVTMILFGILVGFVYIVVIFICEITLVGIILLPFVMFACYVSCYNLWAQFGKSSPAIKEVNNL